MELDRVGVRTLHWEHHEEGIHTIHCSSHEEELSWPEDGLDVEPERHFDRDDPQQPTFRGCP